ncbi:hypothetical protein COO60DRAFT_487390 [Scenedesmus sp. NREL 46B-D3]|nr:hypothetical protein COO60DRAFT_487390 [Scenedesmus sp. NREL 46B-D3]
MLAPKSSAAELIPRSQWEAHKKDECEHGKRFVKNSITGKWEPAMPFWYFGLFNEIQKLHANPQFAAARGQSRPYNQPGTFYASREAQRINTATDGAFFGPLSSGYTEGMDGLNVFSNVVHSTHVGSLMCEDLPPELRWKLQFIRLLYIIPGTPNSMEAYQQPLDMDWARAGRIGFEVTPAILDTASKAIVAGTPFNHKAFLTGIAADAPARALLAKSVACFVAYLACMYCMLAAERVAGVNKYLGYSKPSKACCGPGEGHEFTMRTDDELRQYSAEQMTLLAMTGEECAKQGIDVSSVLSIKGQASMFRRIWYTNPKTLFLMPYAHALLHGVFKDLLKAILAAFSRKRITIISSSSSKKTKTAKKKKSAGRSAGAAQQAQQSAPAAAAAGEPAVAGLGGLGRGQTARGVHVPLVHQPAAAAAAPSTAAEAAEQTGAATTAGESEAQQRSSLALPPSKMVSHDMRRIMTARAAGVIGHPGLGRQYSAVCVAAAASRSGAARGGSGAARGGTAVAAGAHQPCAPGRGRGRRQGLDADGGPAGGVHAVPSRSARLHQAVHDSAERPQGSRRALQQRQRQRQRQRCGRDSAGRLLRRCSG